MAVWREYLDHFEDVDAGAIREGCAPQRMEHAEAPRDAVVLVHGLTDSPYFMRAVGQRFFDHGWNVYLPLLHMHGLRDPRTMAGVSQQVWKRQVAFAVAFARARSSRVSIGGLSTGGTLATFEALRPESDIDGAIFLFAAALALHPPPPATLMDKARARITATAAGRLAKRLRYRGDGDLIGANPYRYDRMVVDGVRELITLLRDLRALMEERDGQPCQLPLFVAHSEHDVTADIRGVERLFQSARPEAREFFRLESKLQVSHAELILERDIEVAGRVLEKRNPCFDAMMEAGLRFADRATAQPRPEISGGSAA